MNQQESLREELSPPPIVRNDSLVFSITAQKQNQFSPHQTDLLKESSENEQSRELFDLNYRIKELEGKVQSIKTQNNEDPMTTAVNENYDGSNVTNITLGVGGGGGKIGCFVKKQKININPFIPNTSVNVTKRKRRKESHSHSLRNDSINNNKSLNNSDTVHLRRQLLKLKLKEQKSKRSASRYSEKLSESKTNIKRLKQENKKYDRVICNLNRDLKKSENIRLKQKQTILKQKKEIDQLREMISVLNINSKVVSKSVHSHGLRG